MIPYTRVVNATIDSSTPKGSSRPGCAFFEFGTISAMASTPAMTNGTFTRNTEPHQKYLSSAPPAIGPIAMAMPEAPAHMPIAFGRSLG
jgi:hypothetical protein